MSQFKTLQKQTLDIPAGAKVSVKYVGKTDGYDGHSLRAFAYFPDRLPGIVDTIESINSIGDLFEEVRQDSKPVTFALTYEGNYMTLMNNCGFSEKVARQIEDSYKSMYSVSVKWKEDRIAQCVKDGFATVAFGLRVRTPLLAKSIMGSRVTTFQAAAEGRTVGNATGQSYGLLNSRAGNEVMDAVRADPVLRMNVKPCAQIHDALYFLVKDEVEIIERLNNIVGNAMSWQDLPEIQHDKVKLSGELDLFIPSWAQHVTLPNGASKAEIISRCTEENQKRKEKLINENS